MKNRITFFTIILGVCLMTPAFSQADENSRTPVQLAKKKKVSPDKTAPLATSRNNGDDTGDDGQYVGENNSETIDFAQMARQIVELEELVYLLQVQNEQLSAEILAANRKSDLCCSASSKSLTTSGYLQQSAPNPFYSRTSVGYFIPEEHNNAQLEIRGLDGKVLKSFRINQSGTGNISIESANLNPGTYVYSLIVDGAVVDSKIMILTEIILLWG